MRLGELARPRGNYVEKAVNGGIFRVLGKRSRERYLLLGEVARDAMSKKLAGADSLASHELISAL